MIGWEEQGLGGGCWERRGCMWGLVVQNLSAGGGEEGPSEERHLS